MDGSRSSAAIRTGSIGTGPWWGTKESREIGAAAARLRSGGNFAGAEALYQRQLELGERSHDDVAIIRSLMSVGGARALQHHYRSALSPLLEARRLAKSIGDRLDLGGADLSISSLYLQMWDVDSAISMSEEGLAASASLNKPYYRHLFLLQLGSLDQMGDGRRAVELFQKGIEAAREQGDAPQEARGWDLLGEQWMRRRQFSDSERAMDEAFRIRILRCPAEVPFSYARLGALKLAQGEWPNAARLTNLAIAAGRRVQSTFPEYLLRHQRGRIRLAQGDVGGAIEDFRAAVEQAAHWQEEVLPASSILTATNSELQKGIFDSFIETAAHEAIETGNPALAREAFETLEWNRAQSLRETVGLASFWREKLPAEYQNTLEQGRAEQQRMLRTGLPSDRRDRIKLKLTEMEAEAGVRFHLNQNENFPPQTSLIHLQQGLSESELLLSFYFGSEESYVWALTRQSLNLYALAPASQIRAEIEQFRKDVLEGSVDGRPPGGKLYLELFGQLTRDESGRRDWLLSLDDLLFEAPLAAATTETDGQFRYVAEMHSLKVVPGALWLNGGTGKPEGNGWFLGVGDPIYNAADSRWQMAGAPPFRAWFARASTDGLNRLVASRSEVESSAKSWGGSHVILIGTNARRDPFLALAGRAPSVIHLATHVLTPGQERGQALIAFGLEAGGGSGYLTTTDIAMLSVPGAIVTMTGCETGGGEALAGAGLLGLTRAWQIAGARAVISTLWPVKDSKGDIFASFYRNLHHTTPAEALRRSQVEMIRSGTWRAEPRYWAGYQVTGGQLAR